MQTFTQNKNQFIVALVPQREELKKTSPMNASVLQTLGTLNNNLPL